MAFTPLERIEEHLSLKLNIALFCVATGGYSEYVPALWGSALRNFLPSHNRKLILATDDFQVGKHEADIIAIPTEHRPWPLATLGRYALLTQEFAVLRSFDYVFMIDADMKFNSVVGAEVLGEIVAVQHPGYAGKPWDTFPLESNQHSTAYRTPHNYTTYYAGAFQGGTMRTYLDACGRIARAIAADSARKITARWHDESHWNAYLANFPPDIILGPEYCWPQPAVDAAFAPHAKIVALYKKRKPL